MRRRNSQMHSAARLACVFTQPSMIISRFLSLPPNSCDKKLLELGWQEKTTWEEGLKKTIDWYLNYATREYW